MLQLDLQQIISQAVSFLLLLWALKRFAWKPLLGMLDARRARIEDSLKQIEQGKAEMARLQQELTQRLGAIDEETRAKIQQAMQEGRRIASEIQDDARAQAHAILEKSKETVALELAKAKVTLRDDLVALTSQAVERLLQQKLTDADDRRLIESILDDVERPNRRPQ